MQTSVETEQLSPAQQGCPVPPHAAHCAVAHTVLEAVHCEPQQASFTAPQAAQCPVLSQLADADWQVVPQHSSPIAPHAVHIPPVQVNPVEQAEPPQHSCMSPPHATHVPSLPHRLPAAQVEPAQHF